jgi:hypothetical protein
MQGLPGDESHATWSEQAYHPIAIYAQRNSSIDPTAKRLTNSITRMEIPLTIGKAIF